MTLRSAGAVVVVVVVVELSQTPEDDPQKRCSCAWKADELITVDVLVKIVMAMVGLVGAGMEVVDGKSTEQSQGVGRILGNAEALPE